METYSPEDILIDNLSFKLNKGSSYITDRRAVSFWPTASNVFFRWIVAILGLIHKALC